MSTADRSRRRHCALCGQWLDNPARPDAADCGGDCLRCMAEVAEDPDAIEAIAAANPLRARVVTLETVLKNTLEVLEEYELSSAAAEIRAALEDRV